jgi:hypothetical protein
MIGHERGSGSHNIHNIQDGRVRSNRAVAPPPRAEVGCGEGWPVRV